MIYVSQFTFHLFAWFEVKEKLTEDRNIYFVKNISEVSLFTRARLRVENKMRNHFALCVQSFRTRKFKIIPNSSLFIQIYQFCRIVLKIYFNASY